VQIHYFSIFVSFKYIISVYTYRWNALSRYICIVKLHYQSVFLSSLERPNAFRSLKSIVIKIASLQCMASECLDSWRTLCINLVVFVCLILWRLLQPGTSATHVLLIAEVIVKSTIVIQQSWWLDSFWNNCYVSEEQLKTCISFVN
jgi:hypothetical protein